MAYRKIGDFVTQVSEKNVDGKYSNVLGVSIDKEFMPSVANIIGTDLNKYNVIRKNRFAFNPMHVGRDKRLPVAIYKEEEPSLVSPAYIMFEITDKTVNAAYLMMLFKTDLFDHLCWFYTDASVRGGLTWSDFSNILINIPSIEEQEKIVSRYNAITKRMCFLSQINDNLLKLMEMIFNNWIQNLKEYEKSNLNEIAQYTNGLAMQNYRPKENEDSLPVIKIKEMNSGISGDTERCSCNIKDDVKVDNGDVLFAWSGTLCMCIWGKGKAGLNQHIFKVTSKKYPKWFYYLWTKKHLDKFILIAQGKATTMGHIKREELSLAEVLIPRKVELEKMDSIMNPLLNKYISNLVQNVTLKELRDLLLLKLMNIENEKEV